mmetsp:Transcript_91104/g.235256  ORF Transcript_91104/g.235256 Transcript_91104/m.235256 type:complete len:531 (+) Transcript_91104:363-1955(+)
MGLGDLRRGGLGDLHLRQALRGLVREVQEDLLQGGLREGVVRDAAAELATLLRRLLEELEDARQRDLRLRLVAAAEAVAQEADALLGQARLRDVLAHEVADLRAAVAKGLGLVRLSGRARRVVEGLLDLGAVVGELGLHAERVAAAVLGLQLRGAAQAAELPVDHDRQARAEHLALLHRMAREHNRVAPLAQVADDVPQEAARAHVHAGGGLVEQHDIRVADERQRGGQLALVAAGEVLAALVLVVLQAHAGDHGLDGLGHLRWRDAADARVEGDGLLHRQLVGQGVELRAVAQVLAGPVAVAVHAVAAHEDVAGSDVGIARDHAHRRRLASAVDAEQTEALARGHADVDAAHGVEQALGAAAGARLVEALLQTLEHQVVGSPHVRGARAALEDRRVHALGLAGDVGVLLEDLLRRARTPAEDGAARAAEAEAPLDEQAQREPDRRHDEERHNEPAHDFVAEGVDVAGAARDAKAVLLRDIVHVVVRGDLHHTTAEVVVRQEPREEGLAQRVDRLELGGLVLVDVQDRGG